MNTVTVDTNDWTARGEGRNDHYFLTHRFANGFYLGFYSHSPWGRVHDQERGWVIINPATNELVDELQTYCWGSCSSDYRGWLRSARQQYGATTLLRDPNFGERMWTMSDN